MTDATFQDTDFSVVSEGDVINNTEFDNQLSMSTSDLLMLEPLASEKEHTLTRKTLTADYNIVLNLAQTLVLQRNSVLKTNAALRHNAAESIKMLAECDRASQQLELCKRRLVEAEDMAAKPMFFSLALLMVGALLGGAFIVFLSYYG